MNGLPFIKNCDNFYAYQYTFTKKQKDEKNFNAF